MQTIAYGFMMSIRYQLFSIGLIVLIVCLHSVHIAYSAYNSFLDYDLGKVISYIELYPGFMNYLKTLKFGQGIGAQAYAINFFFDLSPRLLKMGSYFFFIMHFVLVVYQLRIKNSAKQTLAFAALLVAAVSLFVFFESTTLRYLGSYGMLVYCQTFVFGALLLYFCRKYLWGNACIDTSVLYIWTPIFIAATCIDMRFSFYLCVAFLLSFFTSRADTQRLKNQIIAGLVMGAAILVPISTQFYLVDDGFAKFKPVHVLPLLYSGELSISGVLSFFLGNSKMLLHSLVGAQTFTILFFSLFFLIGAVNEIKQRNGFFVFIFILACFSIQMIAAIFSIYPFGNIRYATPLLPFIVFVYCSGVVLVFSQIVRLIKFQAAASILSLLMVCLSFWYVMPKIQRDIFLTDQIYGREYKVIEILKRFGNDEIWCDYASQKIVLGYHKKCRVLATWNYQRAIPESAAFYDKINRQLTSVERPIVFYLFRPFDIPFYDPIRVMLKAHSLKITSQHNARTHIYIIEPKI